MADKKKFTSLIMQHEGLEPGQTPFRITDKSMKNWTSMFDDTIKTRLNPKAKKSPGRENFLYTQKPEDVEPAVREQFRRYDKRKKGISVEDAVRTFDQTGADGKLDYLKKNGIDPKSRLADHLKDEDEDEIAGNVLKNASS